MIIMHSILRRQSGERAHIYAGFDGENLPTPQPVLVIREASYREYLNQPNTPLRPGEIDDFYYEVTTD